MNEQAPNNPDYLQQHPAAIQDQDKAHTLALAGNRLETDSADLRNEMITGLGQTAYEGGYETPQSKQAEKAADAIDRNNRIADTIYNQHGVAYDKLQATKR